MHYATEGKRSLDQQWTCGEARELSRKTQNFFNSEHWRNSGEVLDPTQGTQANSEQTGLSVESIGEESKAPFELLSQSFS